MNLSVGVKCESCKVKHSLSLKIDPVPPKWQVEHSLFSQIDPVQLIQKALRLDHSFSCKISDLTRGDPVDPVFSYKPHCEG